MKDNFDVHRYNREAWNKSVADGIEWTVPVSPEVIAAARRGEWTIRLTPILPIPRDWFPESIAGLDVLCMASGGGQQGPVLAAAGAHVTVLDLSPRQLDQDRLVAQREGLEITTIEGDMADMHALADQSFDLIVNPVSNVFAPHVLPIWFECSRVLRQGGLLLAGFMNPAYYLFDHDKVDSEGIFEVKYTLPYSDLGSASPEYLEFLQTNGWPMEFSHSLDDQIGGQLKAGFIITGFYEDRDPRTNIFELMPVYCATRAIKSTGSYFRP